MSAIAKKKTKSRARIGWLLVLPAVLIRGFFTAYPIGATFYNSLFNLSYLKGSQGFVGLNNFVKMFSDRTVVASFQFTIIFTVVSMAFHIILGIGLALMLNWQFRGRRFLRTVSLIPWAMPMVVAAQAGRFVFNDSFGLINDLIRRFISPEFSLDWLIYPGTARTAVILVDLWKDVPFFAILVLAALQFIPNDIYEAAGIDGSGAVSSFFRITLPSIAKTVSTISIFFTLWRLSSFDIAYGMTSGGPTNATNLLAYQISVTAFRKLDLGYASAMAALLFGVMLIISSLSLAFSKRFDA